MSRYIVTALVAGLVLGAAPAPKEDEVKKEVENLRGTWKVASIEDRGKADQPPDGFVLVFEKDSKEVVVAGTFKLDPSKKPKAIDVTVTRSEEKGNNGKELHGIYEIDKDTLKWCTAEPGDKGRPTEFATKEGSRNVLFTVKKEKK
jgi:uncharacterized protein (TIGR03067 family)